MDLDYVHSQIFTYLTLVGGKSEFKMPGKVGNRVVLGKGLLKSEDSKMASDVVESLPVGANN